MSNRGRMILSPEKLLEYTPAWTSRGVGAGQNASL
jgi:hypothetical protein